MTLADDGGIKTRPLIWAAGNRAHLLAAALCPEGRPPRVPPVAIQEARYAGRLNINRACRIIVQGRTAGC